MARQALIKAGYGLGIVLFGAIFLGFQSCESPNNNGGSPTPTPANRFQAGIVTSPTGPGGYSDSIFVNSDGSRIYFLNTPLSPFGFLTGNASSTYPIAKCLPGHIGCNNVSNNANFWWNSDLYYIQWNGSSWSAPTNLGSTINSLGNECCVWLSSDEKEIIFHRDNLGHPEFGPTGNLYATRSSVGSLWSAPTPLSGSYGSSNTLNDLQRGNVTKDLYLWENSSSVPAGTNAKHLMYGHWNGTGWNAPALLAVANMNLEHTQPYISNNELTLIYNERDASGNTLFVRATRAHIGDPWSSFTSVPLSGFTDSAGATIWGEPTFPSAENFMLFIRFDTSVSGWNADMMYVPATPLATSIDPPTKLN